MSKRMVFGESPSANPGVIDDLANLLDSGPMNRGTMSNPTAEVGVEDQDTNQIEEILDADILDEQETNEVDVVTNQDLEVIEEVLRKSSIAGLAEAVDANRPDPVPKSASASVSASASFVDARVRRSFPWAWLALTGMLGGGLVYVLATETDLFEGDLVARRQAEAHEETAKAQAELNQKVAAEQPDYGTVQINSVPEGARVWLVKPGPKATFTNLPRNGEYHVVVFGEGFAPRGRALKGSELEAPVILDLDPLQGDSPSPAFPDLGVPKVGSRNDMASLELRSNTPGARLGLLLGWTPGVSVVDLDTSVPHQFMVDHSDHGRVTVMVRPEDWQEGPDGVLVSLHTVTLADPESVEEDEEAEGEVLEVIDEEPEPAIQKPKKKKRRRKARPKRR